jgi:hypothetical protein
MVESAGLTEEFRDAGGIAGVDVGFPRAARLLRERACKPSAVATDNRHVRPGLCGKRRSGQANSGGTAENNDFAAIEIHRSVLPA